MGKEFHEILKELRIRAGYTQKNVYEMLNIPQSTFSSWETGKAEPSASMTLKLCEIYHVDNILNAFGFDGYNKDGSIKLNLHETDQIKKYRSLDKYGTDMVDTVLDKEYERCTAEETVVPFLNAAHARTDIDPTDEMRQHDEEIMDDPDF